MSSPIAKSVKRPMSRSTSRHSSATSLSRKRVLAGRSTRLKPATKRSPAGKAPARKAAKVVARKQKAKSRIVLAKRQKVKVSRKPAKQTPPPRSIVARPKKTPARLTKAKPVLKAKPVIRKPVLRRTPILIKKAPPSPPPQPTHDEAAALAAFE